MLAPGQRLILVALAAAGLGACAHSPPPRTPARSEVLWPEPPATPRVRLASVAPDPDAPPVQRSFWRRIVDAVVGVDPAEEASSRPLERPFGVAAGPAGDLYVADPDLQSVARLHRDGAFTAVSCPDRAWEAPMALTTAAGGDLLVADAGAAQIVRVASDGRCSAFGAGELERPTGIAERGGRIFVADPPRHTIAVFDVRGALTARIGTRGEGDGELSFPTAVAIAPDGTLLVVDALNFRVGRFSADGRWLGAFGAPGDEGGAFARPKGIAAGADGRIYVSDAQRDVVLVFLPDGSFDYAIGSRGEAPGRFAHPAGLAIDGSRLHVADSHNGRIQAFDVLAGGRT